MFGKNTPNDIFVDFDPESERDDLCDGSLHEITPMRITQAIDRRLRNCDAISY